MINLILVINKSLVCANRKVKVDTVKAEKSNRILLVSDSLLSILKEEKEKQQANEHDYVVLSRNGERFNPSSFARRYTELRERKEVKNIRFHDLRHTNANIMYKA
ncbi:tyrosine-type recombinase/integrase [Anaeromicrobium sediminis]|uniref:tyrosine-type recombinase/integrase n=1 Tax=Anaeromicrobium sediminis TaxID=1478221 RepID=UPI0015952373|nr:tyrosine-type recombinase/integrase [Anaeromicrobium sediminis]